MRRGIVMTKSVRATMAGPARKWGKCDRYATLTAEALEAHLEQCLAISFSDQVAMEHSRTFVQDVIVPAWYRQLDRSGGPN